MGDPVWLVHVRLHRNSSQNYRPIGFSYSNSAWQARLGCPRIPSRGANVFSPAIIRAGP